MEVKISRGNSKMGNINSVSLPSIKTCIRCGCNSKCYANKIEKLRPSVRNAYQTNLDLLNRDSDTYWREVEASIMTSRFFRFHVSGDIPNYDYFVKMVEIAKRNPHCEILCFTKKYSIINDYVSNKYLESVYETTIHPQPLSSYMVTEDIIPNNLHITFSAWIGLEMSNPFSFPEAHVRYRDGSTTANDTAYECNGNCTECAVTGDGCWTLGVGDQVVFDEH